MMAGNSQQENGSYVFSSSKALWCLRPESNRYARFHEAADFKLSMRLAHTTGTRMDARLLGARTVRQMRGLRAVGQKIPSRLFQRF